MQHAPNFRSSPARTALNLLLVIALLAVLLPFGVGPVLAPRTASAAVPGVTQTYYLPMPADDHLASLIGIGGSSTLCCTGPMETFVSIVSGTNNNSIAIDHWEDGYDSDPIASPSGTTEVYLRNAGQVISAFDSIPVPRTPVAGERTPAQAASPTYYLDGRDKIVATGLAAVTIGGWAEDPGPFHAGALAAYDVDKMGFTFESPLGEDANVNNLFDYVGMMLISSETSTVDIDADANGIFETTITLNEGETHFIDGGVNLGATVESTGRIGAYLATGDQTATFEGRYIELFPNELWFNEYVSPVGSTVATNGKSRVYVYNPGPGTINVDYLTGAGASGTLSILEGTRTELELPDGEGTQFTSQGGEPFYATQMFGADASSSSYDWGFTLVPGQALTPVVIVPYGPGSQDYYVEAGINCQADPSTTSGTVGADGQFDCNYSPLWVTPLANTRIYIDLDADPTTGSHAGADPDGNLYDFHCDLTALQSRQIYADGSLVDNTSCLTIATQPSLGTGPRDLTGARVYTTDGVDLAAAWGQAPIYRGRPALDLGTAVFPFPSVHLEKITVLSGDVDGDGLVDPGDELTYQIWGTNNGLVAVNGIVVTDVVPANTTYVAGSTSLSFYDDLANLVSGPTAQPDDGVGTPTPLDESGFTLGSSLPLQQSFLVSFKVMIDDPIPFGTGVVVNDVAIASAQGSFFDREITQLDVPKLQLQKSSDVATAAQSSDTITYTLELINNDDVDQTNVMITDTLPAGVTYVPSSASVPDAGSTPFPFDEGGYNLGTLTVGSAVQTLTFQVTVDQPMTAAVTELTNSATATSDQESHSDLVVDAVSHRSDLTMSKVDLVDPVVAGGQITYELTVTNNGPDEASSIVVEDPLPAGTAFNAAGSDPACVDLDGAITCATAVVGVGAGNAVTYTVVVDVESTTAGTINNMATVTFDGIDENPGDESASAATFVEHPVIDVVKTTTTPTVDLVTNADYFYAVSIPSPGNVSLTGIDLIDDACSAPTYQSGDAGVIGTLEVSETWQFTCSTTLTGDTVNTVTATGTPPTGPDVTAQDTASVDVLPDITVVKSNDANGDLTFSDTEEAPSPSASVTFQVEITNNTTDDVTITSVTDDLFSVAGSSCEALEATTLGGSATVTCTFPGTAPTTDDGSATDTVTVIVTDATSNTDTATDTSTVTTADLLPSITVVKSNDANGDLTFSDTEQAPGLSSAVTFQVEITNNTVESVTIDSISDDLFSVAGSSCEALEGTTLGASATVTCTFDATGPTTDNSSDTDTVSVVVSDDDGNTLSPAATDTSTVTTADLLPDITVVKSNDANGDLTFSDTEQAPGLSSAVTFQVEITNNTVEAVTIDSISDDLFSVAGSSCEALEGTTLGASATVTCTFDATGPTTDNSSDTDTVSVVVSDDDGNTLSPAATDTSTVTTADVLPDITVVKSNDANGDLTFSDTEQAPGLSSAVTFQVEITNNTVESVTIDSISDDLFSVAGSSCEALEGTTLGASATVTCTFDATGPTTDNSSDTDTVSVVVSDDDGNTLSPAATDTSTVTTADLLPSIVVTKTASPSSLPEPSGDVTFTVIVENTSTEDVTLDSLDDDIYGDLFVLVGSDCASVTIVPGAGNAYSCSFTQTLSGNAAATHTNVATASVTDDESNVATHNDSETVTFTNVTPVLVVTKGGPASIAEPAGTVTFTIDIENQSTFETVTLTSLTDSVFGDVTMPLTNPLVSSSSCGLVAIAPAATYSCSFDADISGNATETHTNTITAVGSDDDGSVPSAADDHTVTFTDALPTATVTKTAGVAEVHAFGGLVTFTVRVDNTSDEPLNLTSLTDDIHGNVADVANPALDSTSCTLPQAIGVGSFYECTFDVTPSGTPGATETDTVTATLADDELNSITPSDTADVRFGDAVIGDFVFLDSNGDGASTAESGVGDVTINLYDAGDLSTVIATTTSDSGTGAYQFTGLAPGSFVIEVVPPTGFTFSVQDAALDTIDSDVDVTTGQTVSIAVAQSESNLDAADAGFVPASIGGRMWLDADEDHVRPSTNGEAPIEGITVELYDASLALVDSTTTAADGRYSFAGLLPADYTVQFVYPGAAYSTAEVGGDETLDSDVNAAGTVAVTATSGSQPDVADAGVLPGFIGDFLWNDLDADGIQDGGEPGLGSVTVELWDAGADLAVGGGDDLLVDTAITVAGAYSFAASPSSYYVKSTPVGWEPAPSDVGANDAVDSDLDAAGVSGVFALASGADLDTWDAGFFQQATVGDLVWLDLDGDGIKDGAESGLAGASVDVWSVGPDLLKGGLDDVLVVTSATTDGTGLWSVLVDPGTYYLEYQLPIGHSFTPADVGVDDSVDSDADPVDGTSAAFTVTSGGTTTTWDAGAYEPVWIGDLVWEDTNGDGLQAGEFGVTGVTVELLDAADVVVDSVDTNALGGYTFLDVAPGTYSVRVVLPAGFDGFGPQDVGANDAADSDVDATGTSDQFVVESGDLVTNLDAAIYGYATIGDIVWDDSNADGIKGVGESGIDGVRVRLFDADDMLIDTVITAGGGIYSFVNVVPGDHYLIFDTLPATFQFSPPDQGGNDAIDSDPATGNGTTATFNAASRITDDTWDAGIYGDTIIGDLVWLDLDSDGIQDSGEPGIEGLAVELLLAAVVVDTTTTDADGNYTFSVTPDTYTVRITPPESASFTTQSEPAATAATDSDVDAGGEAVVNATTTGIYTDDADAGVAPASIGDVVWLDLDEDGVQDIGEPGIEGVAVELYDAGNVLVDTAVTASDGTYEFVVLPAQYRVTILAPIGATFTALNDPAGTTATDSDVNPAGSTASIFATSSIAYSDMADAGILPTFIGDRVWVDLDSDGIQDPGEPGVEGITVNLYDGLGALVATTTTDSNGLYEFIAEPGTYRVEVVPPTGGIFTTMDEPTAVEATDSDIDPVTHRTVVFVAGSGDQKDRADAGLLPAVIGDRVWLDVDEDGTQDGGELGIEDVTVELYDDASNLLASTLTDSNGDYGFSVAPSDYQIKVIAPPNSTFTAQDVGADGSDSDVAASGLTAVFTAGSGIDGDVADAGVLPKTIGDVVWLDLDSDGVQDGGEPGIENITVELWDVGETTLLDSAITDASGTYLFTGLEPTDYLVKVIYPLATFTGADAGADDTVDSDVDLTGRVVVAAATGFGTDTADAGVLPATIGDFVWLDENDDGIQDLTEIGVEGVAVDLYADLDGDLTFTVLSTDTTDAAGAYAFSDLAPSDYYLDFRPAAGTLSPQDQVGTEATDSDADPLTGLTATVAVASGTNNDVDAGLLAGDLDGRVYLDANSDGVQDGGEPGISAITVELYDATGTVLLDTTTTIADGTYGFIDLVPGDYEVRVIYPEASYAPANQTVEASDSDVDAAGSVVVSLGSGSNSAVGDAGVLPATLGDTVWYDSNANGIQDLSEISRIQGAVIDVYRAADDVLLGTTTTDINGNYSFTDLVPGLVYVEVTLPAKPPSAPFDYVFSPADAGSDDSLDSDVDGLGLSPDFTVNSGDNLGLDAGAFIPIIVGDMVWLDLNADGIYDPSEPGAPGVTVNIYDVTGVILVATTVTDSIGGYSFDGLPSTDYVLEVIAPAGAILSPQDQGADDAVDSDVAVVDGRVAITSPAAVNTHWDAGIIPTAIGDFVWLDLDEDGIQDVGEPGAAGVIVNLLDNTGLTVVATTTTAADGSYVFHTIPGDYIVEVAGVAGTDYSPQNQGGNGALDSDINILTGRTGVISAATGSFVDDADAGIIPARIGDFVWVDFDGDGVFDFGEPPIPDLVVNLIDALGNTVDTTTTDAGGLYSFDAVPGDYQVEIVLPAGGEFTIQDEPSATEATDSDVDPVTSRTSLFTAASGDSLDLADAGVIFTLIGDFVWLDLDGDGVQDGGEPGIEGVTVELYDDLGGLVASTTTDSSGLYSFSVAPNAYEIRISPPAGNTFTSQNAPAGTAATDSDVDGAGSTGMFNAGSGDETAAGDAGLLPASIGDVVWLDLNEDGVNDPSEPGIEGLTVELRDAGNVLIASTTTDVDGAYLFTVPAGSYTVTVVAPFSASFTTQDAVAATEATDSDADASGDIAVTVNPVGDYTAAADAGILPALIGDLVWLDLDNDGVQDGGEPGVEGWTVNLLDAVDAVTATTTTDSSGAYQFYAVPGHYSVQVIAPAAATFSAAGAGSEAIDSDVNPAGQTGTVFATTSSDYTDFGDAGIVPASLGDFVWLDIDGDGIFDVGESGVDGITVEVYDPVVSNVVPLTTTITASGGGWQVDGLEPDHGYLIVVVAPSASWSFTTQNSGGDDSLDSDVDGLGSVAVTPSSGDNDDAADAGFVGGSLAGRVYEDSNNNGTDDAETGVDAVTITLAGTDELGNAVSRDTVTDSSGNYSFDGVLPGTYSVSESQPVTHLDGADGIGSLGGVVSSNDVIGSIVVTGGDNGTGYVFGELLPASLAGRVIHDANNNGVDDAEDGVGSVTVTLTGTDDLGAVSLSTSTSVVDGSFSFEDLRPGTYTVSETQPTTHLDGLDAAGTAGGDAGSVNDEISGVVLDVGETATGYLYGELEPASLQVMVFEDRDNDGVVNGGEGGIEGVPVTLTGTDDFGPVSITTTTAPDGTITYDDLRPGTYTLTESQPVSYLDGADTAGTLGGNTAVNDSVSAIPVTSGDTGTGYLFAEVPGGSIEGDVWFDVNGDGVLDGSELLLEGVTVKRYDTLGNELESTLTDASGHYVFADLYPGDHVIGVLYPNASYAATGADSEVDPVSGEVTVAVAGNASSGDADAGVQPAILGDLVWIDADGDGLQGAEPGLDGVIVSLDGTDGLGGAVSISTTTDVDGLFELRVLPGSYTVTIVPPAGTVFTSPNVGLDEALDSDVNASGVSSLLNLSSGTATELADAGVLTAVVSDSVWLDLNGDGTQDVGEDGIPGVTVELYNNLGVLVDTDVTDSAGDYEFTDVTPADYSIVVVYPEASFTASGPDSDVDAAGQSPAFTAGGTTTDVADAGVLPASMSSSVWLDLDGDGIFNGSDSPVAGVSVELRDSLGNVVTTTLTDSSGDYAFGDLPPGSDYSVTVVVSSATFATVGDADTDVSGLADPVVLLSGPNVGSGDAAVLPTLIGDLVWLDLDGDGVQGLAEPGVAGVTIEVFDGIGGLVATTVTDADGNYSFTLVPGTYEVVVTAPGGGSFATQTSATSDGSDVDSSGSTGILAWGSGDLTTSADAGVRPADIGGVVWLDEDADGLNGAEPPVAGIIVNLFDGMGSLVASTITAVDGTYSFADLIPGDYVVQVVSGGVDFTAQGGDSDVDDTTGEASLTAVGSHSVDAGLLPGFISGTVWSDIDGDGAIDVGEVGVGGVTVDLYSSLGVLITTTTTDGAGLYSFGPFGSGTYSVVVDGSGFPAGTAVTADPDATLDGQTSVSLTTSVVGIDFGYQPPATVSGVVFSDLDGDGIHDVGEPGLSGVTVTIVDADGPITLVTGADGSYSAIVAPGSVDVDVDATTVPGPVVLTTGNDPQSLSAIADTVTTAGATGYQPVGSVVGSLWFDVDAEGTIAAGEPLVAGVLIELVNSSGAVVASTTTGVDGSYRFDGVPPGTYTVRIAGTPPWGIVPVGNPSVVVTAAESKVDLPLVGTETFAGTLFEDSNENGIQDPGEEPIVGASVTLTWHGPDGIAGTADDIIYTTITDSAGNYEFAMLPEGEFSVVIESAGLPPTVSPPPAALVSIAGGSCVTSTGSSCGNVPNVVLRPAVDLTVSITPNVETVAVGDIVIWTIEVTNNGPGIAEGPIEVIVTLPEGLDFVSMEGAGWELLEVDGVRVLVAHVDSLPEGGKSKFLITSRVVVLSASLQAMVTVGGSSPESNLSNNADVASLGSLPFTGLATRTLGMTAMLLLGAGVVLLAAARRRERWLS